VCDIFAACTPSEGLDWASTKLSPQLWWWPGNNLTEKCATAVTDNFAIALAHNFRIAVADNFAVAVSHNFRIAVADNFAIAIAHNFSNALAD
jgi:hypothetical protein